MMIQEKLQKARNDYREKLRQRLDQLGEQLARLRRGAEDGDLDQAQRLAHRICGSAGSFGFTAAGEAVRTIDQILLSIQERQIIPSPALWDHLEQALKAAQRSSAG